MNFCYDIGDRVIQIEDKVTGKVIKFYVPTACKQQTMILCDDGRRYHAPSDTFVKVSEFEDNANKDERISHISMACKYDGMKNNIERYRNSVLQKCNVCMQQWDFISY